MTIYQIISPNGTKVCKIKAVSKVTLVDTGIYFYDKETIGFRVDDWIAEIPDGWVAIPVDIIETDSEN
jgi:hypothetical protein